MSRVHLDPRLRSVPRRSRLLVPFVLPCLLLLGGCGGGGDAGEEAAVSPDTAPGPGISAGAAPGDSPVAVAEPGPGISPDASAAVDVPVPAPATGVTPTPDPESSPDTLTGEVATFGAEPLVHYVLRLDDGQSIPLGTLGGSLDPEDDVEGVLPELARLTGARVRVLGTAEAFAAAPLPGFAVAAYELLEVEGERPVTGRLVRGNAEAGIPDRLEAGGVPARVIIGLPPETPTSGSRIWILGTARGDSLLVQSFGVLRPGS